MNATILMTPTGKKLLEKELEQLIKIEREGIKKAISEARALGDLKENSEYHSAKEKQSHIEGRILNIQSKINRSKTINPSQLSGDKVVFGATVTIYNEENDKSITYQIVGDDESQLSSQKISYNSPLGRALIGLEKGDIALVKAPKGDIEYDITAISF